MGHVVGFLSEIAVGTAATKGTPSQRQELGRLLIELNDDGVRLANELGPEETNRLLAHYVDDYGVVDEGLVVRGSRHGIDVEARYVDHGEAFVDDLADGEDLSKGAIGEEAAYAMAKERNYEVPDWFEKDSEYQNGIDLIAKDKDTGQWVFIESKFSSSRGSVGIGDLGDTKTKGRQMSNEWIEESLEQMRDDGEISNSRYFELLDALEDNSRKEMVITKNTQQSGFTVAESLNNVGIESVVVNKIGVVVE